jgi:serine/threonine protein kinase
MMDASTGFADSTQALPRGTHLEEFVIRKVLGSGGFGITYLAEDRTLQRQVVIKENLPAQFCWRDNRSLTVIPRATSGEDAANFTYSLESFRKEAATLASLNHPGIVKVLRSFEANGTAYFVMPFVEGTTLDEVLRQRIAGKERFSEAELRDILGHLLDALSYLHERGIYHRDLKPGNILMTKAGPVLIDFGAARQRLSERSLTVIESPGYTPFEQLQSRGKVGPWSDLYALGATMYKAITGETVVKATDRIMDDPQIPLARRDELRGRFSPMLLSSIDRALQPPGSGRFQNVGEWREYLEGRAAAASPTSVPPRTPASPLSVPPPLPPSPPPPVSEREGKQRRKAWVENLVAVAVAAVTAVVAVLKPSPSPTQQVLPAQNESMGAEDRQQPQAVVQPEVQRVDPVVHATKDAPLVNSLGMKFVPLPGTQVLMCIHETRNADYAAYAAVQSGINDAWRSKASGSKQQHPVVNMSYEDADGFCRWLSANEERTYRLPTDAEWSMAVGLQHETGNTPEEKAANGPQDVFPWGSHYYPKSWEGNYSCSGVDDGYGGTAPVMSFRANELGIFDLGGNVFEWCQDSYNNYREFGVLRGASFDNDQRAHLLSSYRANALPSFRNDRCGFRIVLLIPGN